jgi:hypothetical protein
VTGEGRIRISLAAGELEVEGTNEFVAQYQDAIQTMLERLETRDLAAVLTTAPSAAAAPPGGSTRTIAAAEEFGEVLASLPDRASGTDKMLVAGWFVQKSHPDATFSTGEAGQLLVGQGEKLANPSQSLKNNLAAKKVFKVGSRYKVSRMGEDHLRTLLGAI